MAQKSKIFQSNRALGYVSNHVPLVVRYIRCRKENLVVTCVGKAFHTYGCSKFSLLSVSGLHSADITCIGADEYHVFTASDNIIHAWRRGTELKHSYIGHESSVHVLLPFGPHLISVDENNILKVWDVKSEDLQLELTFDINTFRITTLIHPSTYLNKILLGSEQGSMQLWNLNSAKQIYVFKGWSSPVTVIKQAPAIDVVAIGLENGRIIIHNLKYDETVMEFMQDWGVVTNLSFRTDGHPILVSGTLSGHIVMWNLEEKKVTSQLLNAHSNAVNGLQCLPNEPLMVTSSSDNSLKMWIFDLPDGGARLLHLREGHGAPPSYVRFHGSNGHNLISAGNDSSLRIFSTVTETFNKSLGKASYNRKLSKKKKYLEDPHKMPPIIQFTSEVTREKEWDNIAAIHLGLSVVTTWSYDKLKMGNFKLLPERFDPKKSNVKLNVVATCICLTACGNFIVIGYSSGHVDRFNIQSGIHRGSYGNPVAHKGPVRGVATENLNQIIVTGGSDALLKFWHFKSPGSPMIMKLNINESVSFFCFHHDSSMLAIALEDFTIAIMDFDTRKIVRKFEGHKAQLTDATFSPDARWLITSAMDCTIQTWDVPSSQLVDCFQVSAACTSLSFSPTGDYLATTHVDYLGVFLWSNKTLYSHISLSQITDTSEIPLLELPTTQTTSNKESNENDFEEPEPRFRSSEQINENLVTVSTVASPRWKNLLDIDVVKRRNKPSEPLKPPKAAPFFLPTVPSLTMQFDLSKETEGKDASKIVMPSGLQSLSGFGQLLSEAAENNNFQPVIDKLKVLGSSSLDFEISFLAPEVGGSIDLMIAFMKLIESMFNSNRDFELAQAYLGLFLKKHGDLISSESSLREYIPVLQKCQISTWDALQSKLMYNMCVVQTIKGV